MRKPKSYEAQKIGLLLLLFAAGIAGYRLYWGLNGLMGGSYGTRPCLLVLGILAVTAIILALRRGLTQNRAVCLIFASSLALKTDYIYYTSCYMRQQDTLIFDYPMGHLGYIGYLFYNHHLPDFDPRTAWSFSHPPLHHIISAVWVKLQTKLGIELEMAIENIQLLTLFYSCALLLFLYLILRELDIDGLALYAVLLLAAFHPTFVLMSGSVNNDELSMMFVAGALLYTIRWYKDRRMKNILILALMIGCAMMGKVLGGLIAPAIAVVFLIALWKERAALRTKWKGYLGQFAAFAVVVFPLGLWAPLRNKILFDVPLNYAEKLELTDPQYIGNIPLVQRFLDFSPYQFSHLNVQFEEAGTYREFNVFIGLLKTTVFGNFDFYLESPALTAAGTILFWMNVVLAVAAIFAAVRCLTVYRKQFPVEKCFFVLLFAIFMGLYFNNCIQYPHICTMHVRYVLPVVMVELFFIGLWTKEHEKAVPVGEADTLRARLPQIVLPGFAGVWAAASAAMFLLLGAL